LATSSDSTTMPLHDGVTLRDHVARSTRLSGRFIWTGSAALELSDLVGSASIEKVEALRNRSVLVVAQEMVSAARALVELDGVAQRLILCPPDVKDGHLALLAEQGCFDAAVVDHERPALSDTGVTVGRIALAGAAGARPAGKVVDTEWVMFTS